MLIVSVVELALQPSTILVKVKVTNPEEIPVTKPVEVTVAIPGLLLAQKPPEEGISCVVNPTHIIFEPETLISGVVLTKTCDVAFELHPVEASVNVNVALPLEIPVTIPLLLTLAISG